LLEDGSLRAIPAAVRLGNTGASGGRFICTSQNIDTDKANPGSRFLLPAQTSAAEFERELMRDRSRAGLCRYRQDYQAGKVGKETRSRSGKNLAVGRPRKAVNGERLAELRAQGMGWRQIAARLSIGATTARRAFEGLSARHKPITEFWHGFQIRPTTLTASRVQQSIRGSATSSFGIRSSFDSKEHLRPWRHFLNIDDHSESVFCEKARLNALPSKLAFSPDSPH
jgi:hypothetical protein